MSTKDSVQKNMPSLAIIIIVISILLHGYFGWNIWSSSPPQNYSLEFNNAKWIGIKGNLPQGYYRKEVYVDGPVRNAWIKIAASDSYRVYVNGKTAGQAMFSSTEVTGVYDITGNLVTGKNIIGVSVWRANIKEINKVIVEFGYEDRMRVKRVVASDHTWKVAPVEEWQAHGEVMWNSVGFDDSAWDSVDIITAEIPSTHTHFVEINPALFETPIEGHWMWSPDTSQMNVVFQYPFSISGKISDAWLRIASDGRYQLSVNNVRVGSSEISKGYLDIYNIAKFTKRGENTITITASKESSSPGILIDGFLLSGEGVYRIAENNWSVTPLNNKVFKPIAISASYNIQSDGVLTKRFVDSSESGAFRLQNLLIFFLLLSVTGIIWLSVWIGCSFFICRTYKINMKSALLIDAVTHLPSILLLGILFLLKYDINHNISFPYQANFILISILLIFLFKLLFILEGYFIKGRGADVIANEAIVIARDEVPKQSQSLVTSILLKKAPIIILLGLIIIGGVIRIKGLDHQSLYHDEIHMVMYTKGLIEKGYPFKMIGPIERPLATYEILPYPIALSMLIFGSNDFAYRLPAAIFGILTIVLLYYITVSLFNRWTAILATAIYTFLPPAIIWAQYLFHPQQAQLLALLTSFFFYKAIEKEAIDRRFLYMATASYVMLYLTWEGTGFFLVSMFLGLLAVKGKDFKWIKDKRLWIGVGIITGVVLIQLVRRFLLQIPYLVVGTGNSEITAPSLFFLNPLYDPYFYIKNFLWREYNFILTFLCIIGIPFLTKHPLLRYYYTLVFATLFLMTNFFAANALRYAVYLEPLLIISAVAVLMQIARYILQSLTEILSKVAKATACIVILIVCIVLWVSSNDYIYKFYRITDSLSGYHWRHNVYYIDYKTPIRFIANNYQKGDLIISAFPYATELYGGIKTDYFVQSITARQVFYDITEESPMYLERTIGKPAIRGPLEFNDLTNRYHRIWVVAIPYKIFQKITGDSILEYLTKNGRVVYESYEARVYLIGG